MTESSQGRKGSNGFDFGNNGAFDRTGGFQTGKGVLDPSATTVICQICFKPKHIQ